LKVTGRFGEFCMTKPLQNLKQERSGAFLKVVFMG
jgi:hypothetical protein